MSLFKKHLNKKKIIITGHTGFKGSWLTLWCIFSGAKVIGISKGKPNALSHYKKLNISNKITHIDLDIKNLVKLKKIIKKFQPDYIFHLAAQSLVKKSFKEPMETFTSNTVGTLNILDSLSVIRKKCHTAITTSDKSYKNLEFDRGYKENDLLGGDDPYSGSKGAAELIINSYFKSILKKNKNISISISRAGNVIGGGDWSEDRIIPDCIKSWSKNKLVDIRNPNSTRPWQHVLEVLRGYLQSAIIVKSNKNLNGQAFNFGPNNSQNKTVIQLVKEMKKYWNQVRWKINKLKKKNRESKLLKLNSNKARFFLNWFPVLNFNQAVELTANWYKDFYMKQKNCYNLSLNQIIYYEKKYLVQVKKLKNFK